MAADYADYKYENAVAFPFGYGLSYTNFDWQVVSVDDSDWGREQADWQNDGTITVQVKVTNTGSVAGKDVVEIYGHAPYLAGGIEKPEVTLIGFEKTGLLRPGQSETLTLTVNIQDIASFDYRDANGNGQKTYELDAADGYELRVSASSHDVKATVKLAALDKDIILAQLLRLCALAHRLNFCLVKQYTPAVSLEGGKADNFQFCVNLRTVICNLQRFTEQRRALVDAQPLGVHIGENTAEGVVNELRQRRLFDFCQRIVAIAENPVHSGAFLVEHHLNVGKRKRSAVIAGIVPLIFFLRGGRVAVRQTLHNLPPSGTQLFFEFPFSSIAVIQLFPVDEFNFLSNGVNSLDGHQRSAIGADKAAAKHVRQLINGGIGFVGSAPGSMNNCLAT